ncbi:MAG: hypothetical protein M3Y72_09380 [Acidobacteriota bacterium]|nr:hypothetical protein [Acidobacteriota bacterium]
MDRKTNPPASDQTARHKHHQASEDLMPDVDPAAPGLQTSSKSGKHSSAQKLAASRPEFESARGTVPVDGAFGDADERDVKKKQDKR